MFFNQIKVDPNNLPSVFGTLFLNKVKSITDTVNINPNVYNGTRKVNEPNHFFMSGIEILEVIKPIKTKNSEGYDRIPQRTLVDAAHILLGSLANY